MAVKIYTTKASVTLRINKGDIKNISKPILKKIVAIIEIDDCVLNMAKFLKMLEQKATNFQKLGIGQSQIKKVIAIAQQVVDERKYLIELFNNTCGKSWVTYEYKIEKENRKGRNWCTTASLNDWYGVYTKYIPIIIDNILVRAKRVYLLDLTYNNLHGNYEYQINGKMPDDIEKLKYLEELYLQNNFLTNSLPSTLGNLRKLKYLHLEFNQIMGALPHLDNMDSLEELYLDHNRLEDSIIELTKLKKLKKCHIYHNKFSGKVPEELADKKDLTEFKFYNNYMQIGSKVQARIKSDSGWQGRTNSERPAHIVYE
ncbi:MAG: hypothetical protein II817_01820 [Bacteroidales bacterium]|nr:hypothetical protein [Bacteroidales bacterium]